MPPATQIEVSLDALHKNQQKLRDSKAKRKVVVAGRRGGKTTGVANIAVEEAFKGKKVLEAAPVNEQTEAFWENCKRILKEPIEQNLLKKNETTRTLKGFPNGGEIKVKTAFKPDHLRGGWADLLILDEFSFMHHDAWSKVGSPMLLDSGGDAIFIFTPNRKNHAFIMYNRAKADESGRWEAFHFTSYDNPHLDEAALEEIMTDMETEEDYKQEILAQFLDSAGAVFNNIDQVCILPGTEEPIVHQYHRTAMGADWGKQGDYTVFSVGCLDCQIELELYRSRKVNYEFQREILENLFKKWHVKTILAESNAMGQPIADSLQVRGYPVNTFDTNGFSKTPLIEFMSLTFDQTSWKLLANDTAELELEMYQREYTGRSQRPVYGCPSGFHDDTVMSRALMLWSGRSMIDAGLLVSSFSPYHA